MEFFKKFITSGTILSLNSGQLVLGWGRRQYLKDPSLEKSFCFYLNDFFLTKHTPWFRHKYTAVMDVKQFIQLLDSQPSQSLNAVDWKPLKDHFFSSSFNILVNKYLNQGILQKGVPYTFETGICDVDDHRLLASLKQLAHNAVSSKIYVYGTWNQSRGILGGTPEILFRKQSDTPNKVETLACASTQSNHKKNKMFFGIKELREHQLVVEGIKESLDLVGKVTIEKMIVANFPHLSHLFTPIHLLVNDHLSFDTLVRLLHPTPALGAYPKEKGRDWLLQLQKKKGRMCFGAPMGYSYNKEAACYVAIRNMQWKKGRIYLGAGCGVVNESVLENEWKEILLKLNSIKQMLAL